MKQIPNELAPCGVFCGACPSFNKTCLGCASESKEQKRTSKWGCKIRDCCYNIEEKDFCIDCSKFPCKKHRKKLLDTHPGDPKFRYRHEIPEIFKKMKEMSIEGYLEYQKRRWSCPSCGGIVNFYHYKCSKCGKEVTVKGKKMQYENILKKLKALSNPQAVEGMARYGINPENAYGISIPNLRKMAKEIGRDHSLAQQLWDSGIHEARILASIIDEPNQVTKKQMDAWIRDFDSWDVCDQCCMNLFDKTPFVWEKAIEWTNREKEFEKRAGFALMACLAWHNKESLDKKFLVFLPAIKREANDDRNYVKKAVNWALRNIGKRNLNLNRKAIETAREIQKMDSRSAKWIASDAIRELMSEAVQERLQKIGK